MFGKKQDPVDIVGAVIDDIKIIDSKRLITLMKHIIAELDFRDEDGNDDSTF